MKEGEEMKIEIKRWDNNEVIVGDIVCIPIYEHADKFRVKKCEVI